MLKYSSYKSIHPSSQPVLAGAGIHMVHLISLFNKNRKSLIRSLLLIAVLVLSFSGIITAFASSISQDDKPIYDSIVIMPGDTLWTIALANKPSGMDTRKYVHLLTTLNHLSDSNINAGDILNLPNIN